MIEKGIILAGGYGTRLYPLTIPVSKQLMPVYDKPMIYYPLSTLMLAGIRQILIITTPGDHPAYLRLLGDGSHLGISISYAVQEHPDGIPQAFLLGKEFISTEGCALILGDNIFYGRGFTGILEKAVRQDQGATIFGYPVKDPERYGVAEFDAAGKVIGLEEKPSDPRSNLALVGLYFYDEKVVALAEKLKPSKRGELEITDLNRLYMDIGQLHVEILGRGFAWLDTGTHESLLEASNFIQVIQRRQGLMVSCPEEIAFRKGFINEEQLRMLATPLCTNSYGQYLLEISGDK